MNGPLSGVIVLPVQDDRRRQFEHVHPPVTAGLGVLAAAEADRLAIEADYPGWKVSLIEHDGYSHWVAVEDSGYRPAIRADSPAWLRTALAEFPG